MKVLVFQGPGRKAWDERPTRLQGPTHALVRITTTPICQGDPHERVNIAMGLRS